MAWGQLIIAFLVGMFIGPRIMAAVAARRAPAAA